MDSDQSVSRQLSRQSSASSEQLPIDNVPVRMDTPTGIEELANEEPPSEIDEFSQSMQRKANLDDNCNEPYYGKCAKCSNDIVGVYSAVKAMDKVYHKSCFVCTECSLVLDNKPFYCVKGKVYCDKDYSVNNKCLSTGPY